MRLRPRPLSLAVVLLACLIATAAHARLGAPPFSASGAGGPLADVETYFIPDRDGVRLAAEADERSTKEGTPFEFADPIPVSITPGERGTWERLPDGGRLWRMRIDAPGATDLNLGLGRYRLPLGAMLHVIAEGRDYWEGPYTSEDNEGHGQLWLPVIPGSRATVELYVPHPPEFEPEIEIVQIGWGFRDWFKTQAPLRQGWCNNDVICPEGDPWRDQIASVAVYQLQGFWTCTGQMVMNTLSDFKPYFLTANHCGINSSNDVTMVVYWNFESPRCGDLCCGSLSDNQSGAIFRASRSDVDFALVELEEDPDPTFGVYWTGWDRTGVAPIGSVGIHQPNCDEKAISFNDDLLTTMNSCIGGGSQTHWRVNNWEDGTTEPGSSGSGLWNPSNQLLIGFLSGGLASCSNISYDCYGKFSLAWDGSGSSSRLRDWLDPVDSGVNTFPGSFPDSTGSVRFVGSGGTDSCSSDPGNVNGVWEPGEFVRIPVTVLSVGSHTSISGTLASATPGVTIVDDTASWPDLLNGETSVSDAPHFLIQLDETFPCFTDVDFDLTLTSAEGGPWVESFSRPVGGDLTPIGLPTTIPDDEPAGVASPLVVPTDFVITDVDVFVDISHTRVGDLVLKVQSPLGTTVTLLDRPGYPSTPTGCTADDMIVTFDDSFPAQLEQHCAATTPWYQGPARPVEPLAGFNGESTLGTWYLIVEDHNGGDTGQINNWQLLTTPALPGACTPCAGGGVDVPEIASAAGGFRLEQNTPNPFAGRTEVRFQLPRPGLARLEVFDVSGRRVVTLLDRGLSAGAHAVTWDGRDAKREPVATGIYFYRLTSGEQTEIKRLNLVR